MLGWWDRYLGSTSQVLGKSKIIANVIDLEDDCRTSLRLCWLSLPVVRVVMTDYHVSLGMGLGWSSTRPMVSPFASSVQTFVYLAFISALHHQTLLKIPTEYKMFLNILFQTIHRIKSQTITNVHKLHSKLIQTICCLTWMSIGNCYTFLSGNLQRVEIISL